MTILCQKFFGRPAAAGVIACAATAMPNLRSCDALSEWPHHRQLGSVRSKCINEHVLLAPHSPLQARRDVYRAKRGPNLGPLCCRFAVAADGDCGRLGLQPQRWLGDHPCLVWLSRQALSVEANDRSAAAERSVQLQGEKDAVGSRRTMRPADQPWQNRALDSPRDRRE